MSHADPHGPSDQITATPPHHGHDHGHEPLPFTPGEWQSFRTADKIAASYIVVLMQGIFAIGLVLYLIVLWSVV